MAIYDNVKRICAVKKCSINMVENDLNFPRGSICKWNTNVPSVAKVKKVADYLDVTVDELLKE